MTELKGARDSGFVSRAKVSVSSVKDRKVHTKVTEQLSYEMLVRPAKLLVSAIR